MHLSSVEAFDNFRRPQAALEISPSSWLMGKQSTGDSHTSEQSTNVLSIEYAHDPIRLRGSTLPVRCPPKVMELMLASEFDPLIWDTVYDWMLEIGWIFDSRDGCMKGVREGW